MVAEYFSFQASGNDERRLVLLLWHFSDSGAAYNCRGLTYLLY